MATPFIEFNRVADCRYGKLIYNAHDIYIGRSLELYGEFSQGESDLFEQVVEPGSVVLEIGANIGAHTLQLAQLVGSNGRVVAVEPQRIVFQTLCGNMALNSVTNTDCVHAAVGDREGTTSVPLLDYTRDGNFGGISLSPKGGGEQVPMTTIDSMRVAKCDFVKIDVEGMEEVVLRGAQRTIEQFQPLIYLECDRAEKTTSLHRYIDMLGYQMYWHKPPLFNPQNFLANDVNVFGNIVSLNIICVKRGSRYKIQGTEPIQVQPDGGHKN